MKEQSFLATIWRKRLKDRTTALGMRCFPLQARFPNTPAILEVRDIRPSDMPRILPTYQSGIYADESSLINSRRNILKQDPSHCKVVVDKGTGTPCFFFWFSRHPQGDSGLIPDHVSIPFLRTGQAIMGHAYTHPLYRRRGVVSQILQCVVRYAANKGTRELITFVEPTESRITTELQRVGFSRFANRKESSFLGGLFRSVSFESLEHAAPSRKLAIPISPLAEASL
jgi:hypothetical protein